MKKNIIIKVFTLLAVLSVPYGVFAQSGITGELKGLQGVLDTIYTQMLTLCGNLIGVGRGIAGFAATWSIANKVWRHIANAEPIDFYPLFRPFVLGFAVLVFPSVIALMNGVLQPTVTATNALVSDSDQAITQLLKQKEAAVQNSDFYKMYVGPEGNGDQSKWEEYSGAADNGVLSGISNSIKFEIAKASYNFRNAIKQWLSEVLELLYEAASLCINTIRTFYLLVLAILGPLAFGIAVVNGLEHTLINWVARYINIFLWLPVANVFGSILGKIEQNMIQLDINQIQANGDTYFSSLDTGYLIFLIIGIMGYLTVPSLANQIINAGGAGNLLYRTTAMFSSSTQSVAQAGAGIVTNAFKAGDNRSNEAFPRQYYSEDGGGHSGQSGKSGKSDSGSEQLKEKIAGTKKD